MQPFRADAIDVNALWEWYAEASKALSRYERDVVDTAANTRSASYDRFFGLTRAEIEEKFREYHKELSFSVVIA